jgi:iron complex transport system permease protein
MKNIITGILIILFSLFCVFAAPFFGLLDVGFSILSQSAEDHPLAAVFWGIRVPRAALGFVCGGALGIGGMVFQAVFRNPLATPYTLGVSSGAALGATLALRLHLTKIGSMPAVSACSLIGALAATGFVYLFSVSSSSFGSSMLLAGVALSYFCSSSILFAQYMSDFSDSFAVARWMMGSLEIIGFDAVWYTLPFSVIGFLSIWWYARELNLLQFGEELASTKGVEVRGARILLFFMVSLMIAGMVAITGPIGFVGMMVPHFIRLVLGSDHRLITPVVFASSGAFLVVCDTFARTIIAPVEIPVGVVTALIGAPFFLWMLVKGEVGVKQ